MSEAKAGRSSAKSTTKPYPLRIPEGLMELAEAKSRAERTDRSTALRQLLYAGAEDYVMGLLGEGRISASRAAEVLGVSVHRVHEMVEKHRIQAGPDLGDYRRSREATRGLL
jgi:hypothetical protein